MKLAFTIGSLALGLMSFGQYTMADQCPSTAGASRANIDAAMRGEAFAFLKYSLYADKARKEGHPDVAAAFDKVASQERLEHFAELAKIYGLVGSTTDNLADAISGETHESSDMYPAFAATAREEGESAVSDRFTEIARDEQKHAEQFSSLLRSLKQTSGDSPSVR